MFKKLIYFSIVLAGLLAAFYSFQPMKKGKWVDTATKYEMVRGWLHLPAGFGLGNPTGLGIDTNQNIVVFHRGEREWGLLSSMPDKAIQSRTVLIIDKDKGTVIDSWGADLFIMPHGLTVDHENNIWVTDVGLHQIFKFSHNGKLLMKLGEAKVSGNDGLHFNKPTDVAIAKDGSFYVSDGYENSRIVKFSPAGTYLLEWGRNGDEIGAFDIPHGICLDGNGNVYVADRENNRIQVFDPSGNFIKQWTDDTFGSMYSVFMNQSTSMLFAVDDLTFLKLKHRGSDVLIFDPAGKVQMRFGRSGSYQGPTSWYHDLVTDKDENVYVGDILGNSIQKFKKVGNR